MSTFARANDPEFHLLQRNSLASILNQSYKNWTLILIGDGLSQADYNKTHHMLKSSFPMNKWLYHNQDASKREENVLKHQNLYGCTIWCFAGSHALNEGLSIAYSLPYITHIARLDDDDYWKPNHLKVLAEAFQIDENVGFVFSQAHLYNRDYEQPNIENFRLIQKYEYHDTDLIHPLIFEFMYWAPLPATLIHSTIAWNVQISQLRQLRYRLPEEQAKSNRTSRNICCLQPDLIFQKCINGVVMPVDADLFERINRLVVEDQYFKSIFIHLETVYYFIPEERSLLLEEWYTNRNVSRIENS